MREKFNQMRCQIAQHNFKVCDTILDLSDSYQKVVRKKKAA